jgi:hypothetical protein
MSYPDSIIASTKKVVDITAILTEGTAQLLSTMNLQHKNQFEILFTPDSSGEGLSKLKAIGYSLLDSVITKLYIQTIEATFVSFTYERADNKQYLKDVEYPESVKMTFLEDEIGTVRQYMNKWSNSIATIDDNGMFVFEDDQTANKRNAILTPLMKDGLPSGAWVQFKGLKYMSMETIPFDQSSPENMIIDVTFACDNCYWKTPF